MEKKRFLSPLGMLLCGGLLLLAGALFLAQSLAPQGTVAIVEQNGVEVARRQLSQLTQTETLILEGENSVEVTIHFSPQGAPVAASTCPDQVTSMGKMGPASTPGSRSSSPPRTAPRR